MDKNKIKHIIYIVFISLVILFLFLSNLEIKKNNNIEWDILDKWGKTSNWSQTIIQWGKTEKINSLYLK